MYTIVFCMFCMYVKLHNFKNIVKGERMGGELEAVTLGDFLKKFCCNREQVNW